MRCKVFPLHKKVSTPPYFTFSLIVLHWPICHNWMHTIRERQNIPNKSPLLCIATTHQLINKWRGEWYPHNLEHKHTNSQTHKHTNSQIHKHRIYITNTQSRTQTQIANFPNFHFLRRTHFSQLRPFSITKWTLLSFPTQVVVVGGSLHRRKALT